MYDVKEKNKYRYLCFQRVNIIIYIIYENYLVHRIRFERNVMVSGHFSKCCERVKLKT